MIYSQGNSEAEAFTIHIVTDQSRHYTFDLNSSKKAKNLSEAMSFQAPPATTFSHVAEISSKRFKSADRKRNKERRARIAARVIPVIYLAGCVWLINERVPLSSVYLFSLLWYLPLVYMSDRFFELGFLREWLGYTFLLLLCSYLIPSVRVLTHDVYFAVIFHAPFAFVGSIFGLGKIWKSRKGEYPEFFLRTWKDLVVLIMTVALTVLFSLF